MGKIYIDENIRIYKNLEAQEKFNSENDSNYYQEHKGIICVPKERWGKAQRTERKHWMEKGLRTSNDRNDYHFKQFNKFNSLKGFVFNSALEIGCGPFTNLRFISKGCKILSCSLLDPLINDYLKHPFSRYNRRFLFLRNNNFLNNYFFKVFPKFYKIFLQLSAYKIPIKNFYPQPFEEIETTEKFDLIVMINVVEHCFDLPKIFNNILEKSQKGTIFIFQDKLFQDKDIKYQINQIYDAAHPLRIDYSLFIDFFDANFETKYKRTQTKINKLENEEFMYDEIYYIGQRI
jgi:SAM-dependent methyltransferase